MSEEKSTSRRHLEASAFMFFVFIVFTILVKIYDVGPIGPDGSHVGFSRLNATFNEAFGYNAFCYKATQILGYLCILIAAFYAALALLSLVKEKSLAKMDRDLLVTMILYAVVVFFYVLFNKVVINVRPTEPEASYPSSHTMLAICVLYSAHYLLGKSVKLGENAVRVLRSLCSLAIAAMVVMRLLSGVHWLTDIIGAVLLSTALLTCYRGFIPEVSEN